MESDIVFNKISLYFTHGSAICFFFALRNTFTQNEFAYRNIYFFPWKCLCVKAIEMGPLVLCSACLLKSFVSL